MDSKKDILRWLLISQNIVLFGAGMVFPYYIIFIKEAGANFTQFGLAYALFSISAAVTHYWAGVLTDRFGNKIFLAASSWGMAFSFLFFPSVTSMYQVFAIQICMGVCTAFQKTPEKVLVAEATRKEGRGRQVGKYHAWMAVFSSIAVVFAGYTIDILTLDVIFYAASLLMFIGGFAALKIKEEEII